jgi:hypothetical protein
VTGKLIMKVAEAHCGNQLINSRNNICVTLERRIDRGTWLKTYSEIRY